MFNLLLLLFPIFILFITYSLIMSFASKKLKASDDYRKSSYINNKPDKQSSPDDLDALLEKTIALIDENKKVSAIKFLRDNTNMDLKQAKETVDKLSKNI